MALKMKIDEITECRSLVKVIGTGWIWFQFEQMWMLPCKDDEVQNQATDAPFEKTAF